MRNTAKFLVAGALALALALCALRVTEISAYAQAQPAQPAQQQTQQPTFRSTAELVTTDVIVRDAKNDQFMADLGLQAEDRASYWDAVRSGQLG